ncbi:MAG: sugar transferase [Bryobacterales bacterium]|nr:sugar transferase [Bryobacterales bacterium]
MLTESRQKIKRAFDIAAAAAGLVVLWPLLAVISALVYFESPGGVFYRGIRTGKKGRPFRIFKFRTMVPDAEQIGGGSTAKDDPRVTRIGRVLRKYKLDELPQLLNVLFGDMSVVGPRPELPRYTQLYEGDERLILCIRPGITDYASLELFQLSEILGPDDADRVYEERVRLAKNALRVKYVTEQTLAGDMWIVLRTLRKVCRL